MTIHTSINDYNNGKNQSTNLFDVKILDDLYVSPAVTRSIWRTVDVCREIVKIMGNEQKKIFIEMARDIQNNGKKGMRTVLRKKELLELYKNCKKDEPELYSKIVNADEGDLRDNRFYLYYTQLGRCIYSGEKINFSDIEKFYDIDHIYPQSKIKDDSINNKVLVKKTLNKDKDNVYPIPEKCLEKDISKFREMLNKKGLVSKEKYNRLTRKDGFTDDELSGFIARQLVETQQSTKAVATILKKQYPTSEMVYVKAGNVSDFRHQYDIFKSRMVNDYHHAKDAYLNIVVGNVYNEKFTKNFIKSKQKYSLNKVFDYPVKKGDRVILESANANVNFCTMPLIYLVVL